MNNASNIDAPKRAHWIDVVRDYGFFKVNSGTFVECSNCGRIVSMHIKCANAVLLYCYNCGYQMTDKTKADMDELKELQMSGFFSL